MPYDPAIHHRRSIRLPAYDYREAGACFITVCTRDRKCVFDDAALASIVLEAWDAIPAHFSAATVDEFVVMPNHVHGILLILGETGSERPVGAMAPPRPPQAAPSVRPPASGTSRPPGRGSPSPLLPRGPAAASLGAIIGSFKSITARRINCLRNTPGAPVWQRNYYERVLRNDRELQRARQYILDNPRKWSDDPNHPLNLSRHL